MNSTTIVALRAERDSVVDVVSFFREFSKRPDVMGMHSALRVAAASLARVVVSALNGLRPCPVLVQESFVGPALPERMVWPSHFQQRFPAAGIANRAAVLWAQFFSGEGIGDSGASLSAALAAPVKIAGSIWVRWRQRLSALYLRYKAPEFFRPLCAPPSRSVALNRFLREWSSAAPMPVDEVSGLALFQSLLGVGVNRKWSQLATATLAEHRSILPRGLA